MTKRIAVLGAGANGAGIGADLTAAGVDVTLIEQWPAHVEAMRERGLTIHMAEGDLHVQPHTMHLCEVATLKQPFDVVLMLMKAYDWRWAAQLIEPYLSADGLLAGVQNGMSTQAIADVVGGSARWARDRDLGDHDGARGGRPPLGARPVVVRRRRRCREGRSDAKRRSLRLLRHPARWRSPTTSSP